MSPQPSPVFTPQQFREIPVPPHSLQLKNSLDAASKGYGFCGVVTCDIEIYDEFVSRCRAARCRPPSLYAYMTRCLGVTLAPCPELLASRQGNKLFIPSRVDAMVAVEVEVEQQTDTGGSVKTPHGIRIKNIGNRSLADISEEMKVRLREAKRTRRPAAIVSSRFAPASSPLWWRTLVKRLRSRHPRVRQAQAREWACIQLSSTSQWMEGRIGWGVRLYSPAAPSVTMAGISRRPVVVGEDIVAHLCLDVVVTFDHMLVDGAPATRFIAALQDEIESGRVLGEYPVAARNRPHASLSEE